MDADINLVAFGCPTCVDFKEGGKPEYPENNPGSTGEINCDNSTHMQTKCTPDLVFTVVSGTTR